MVQGEPSLTGELPIAGNLGMGAFPRRLGPIDYGALARRAAEVPGLVGLDQPLDRPVRDLPLGRRPMVEIAEAPFRRPCVPILDEPTSSPSAHETGVLAALMRRLRDRGLAPLVISHRLGNVRDL